RKDAEVYLVLEGGEDPPKAVRFDGQRVRYLNPDERSTASLIRNALLKKIPPGGEANSSPGVYVSRRSFADVLTELAPKGSFVYLKEDGTDCRQFTFPENPIFVLGDNHDLTAEEEGLLLTHDPARINVGPLSLHADQCLILVQNELDRQQAVVPRE
ncbi:MAG: tRNA (pseudouridine(54)-N(1))-methyltransferase TrmY, partial [Candidatus Methanomethylophilus sp.]|nr:tRNA (pseudouridine(54)-N(1))-methyltransferase TrmY [Methanomethylophilus sp.]